MNIAVEEEVLNRSEEKAKKVEMKLHLFRINICTKG